MKIKVGLSIGFYGADHNDVLEIDDADLEGLTPDEREKYLEKATEDWANEYIDYWHEEVQS